jgi:hypothetical protein
MSAPLKLTQAVLLHTAPAAAAAAAAAAASVEFKGNLQAAKWDAIHASCVAC